MLANVQTISPVSLKELHDRETGLTVLDVRTPAEFEEVRVTFAKLIPLQSLKPKDAIEEAGIRATDTIYLCCNGGVRSRMAGERFLKEGFNNVCIVEGGVQAWEAAGLPVIRGRKVMSLERQVRIAAGSLVLLGLTLAFTLHPAFAGLSAFVGCGLVFAGITDTCGLGLLLARMPWNQAGGGDTPKACSL